MLTPPVLEVREILGASSVVSGKVRFGRLEDEVGGGGSDLRFGGIDVFSAELGFGGRPRPLLWTGAVFTSGRVDLRFLGAMVSDVTLLVLRMQKDKLVMNWT